MLSRPWDSRRPSYDFVVIGSGYGGAIAAARLALANLSPRPSICLLERGREWQVGEFPDTIDGAVREQRNPAHPLGLYEFLQYPDISVIKGNGLGGTSLVNANVAIVPDARMFEGTGWPASLTLQVLAPYYQRARGVLDARPHPGAMALPKVQALGRRAAELGTAVLPLDLAVNFAPDGPNAHGVFQRRCIDCGDCVTGCNVGAKNTLAMNYLPMAQAAGAEIFTQAEVERVARASGGGWTVHGRHLDGAGASEPFDLAARHVILAAGSINSTEILLRSEGPTLTFSHRLGSGFSGNADFFGLAYNGNRETRVLGFGSDETAPGAAFRPGPTIVAAVPYGAAGPVDRMLLIEDLSFPKAYVDAARVTFALLGGEDTDAGDEHAEAARVARDLVPLAPPHRDGALNHSMLYLCMGFDDGRGAMVLERSVFSPEGRVRVAWNDVGTQVVFERLNEELRRHARAEGARFIQNPLWAMLQARHIVTAHPLGGCPIGEDAGHGAVDEHGRVFSGDGSVHDGLFVADGALVPSALGVNPFLTIAALAESIVERKIQQLQGQAYPAPRPAARLSTLDPVEVAARTESELDRLFRRAVSEPAGVMVNHGGHTVEAGRRRIRNDRAWKGFFPRGHVLNELSAAIFTGFRKRFFEAGGRIEGVTSDTDGRINARNTVETITLTSRQGDLDPGTYVLLRYVDPPWQGFYDIFKVVNDDILVGRAYVGVYPHGHRIFTFPMTRVYGFAAMTVDDHRTLYGRAVAPPVAELAGVWRMDAISNANHAGGIAHLGFELKPDGRLEARYQLLGLMEGLLTPTSFRDHFQLDDFTAFHDEIRRLDPDLLIGRYVTDLPPDAAAALPAASLGLLHTEGDGAQKRLALYYTLSRTDGQRLPATTLLRAYLDAQLPAGVGMTFDEEMVGWYFPGVPAAGEGRAADLSIAALVPSQGAPSNGVAAGFRLRMTVGDLNEFIEGGAHEARARGTIRFDAFENDLPAVFDVDALASRFNYLQVNEATGEAEMRYRLWFQTTAGRRFLLDGRKYMQKDPAGGPRGVSEVLDDYTTLFGHLYEQTGDTRRHLGVLFLEFRTFEDLFAVGSLASFLRSFTVTGTADPRIDWQARMRFLAFTAQFVQMEYDPLAPRGAAPAPAAPLGG